MQLRKITRLILASRSPRRKDLLEQVGIPIEIRPSSVNEKKVAEDHPENYARTLSRLKAEETARTFPGDWVLGADTIVVVQNKILGKPETESHAFEMLSELNNREHKVVTGFCLSNRDLGQQFTQSVETRVLFKNCTKEELFWYIKTGEPFGKAGAYAIQGKGAFLVKSITGSYTNVVGLPVCEVIDQMNSLDLIQF